MHGTGVARRVLCVLLWLLQRDGMYGAHACALCELGWEALRCLLECGLSILRLNDQLRMREPTRERESMSFVQKPHKERSRERQRESRRESRREPLQKPCTVRL